MSALTPYQAMAGAGDQIPEEVIEIVNQLIKENLSAGATSLSARILQKDVTKRITEKFGKPPKSFWLDFEPVFRRAGWNVVYDKPAYNETYDANYKFSADVSPPPVY